MLNNSYNAVWVSHSSIGDYLKCPRAYYLKNIYKDPKSKRKIAIASPALSLGSAVHEVVEGLANFKSGERKNVKILEQFDDVWSKFSGKKGGFSNEIEQREMKERGVAMIKRVKDNIEVLEDKIVKLKDGSGGMLPNFLISPEENIILCGKIDWLKYIPEDDSLHIIDFKTGVNEESEDSLQLPIYQLLLKNLQKRKVSGASYWYLNSQDKPKEVKLPDIDESLSRVLDVALLIKGARVNKIFNCKNTESGCYACRELERVIKGEAEFVGSSDWQDLYFVS
jgi:ATP-dependent helicase/DNAse subunit B